MIIETSRFGQLEVDQDRLITFDNGVLGFPGCTQFALVQTGDGSAFYWLQSVQNRDLAFVVTDPRMFVADYRVPVKLEDLQPIELNDLENAQVFIIVNKVDDTLTGNFQGPLIINVENRRGRQLVLSDKRYSTRHPLVRMTAAGKESLVRTA